jgi:antitoxin component YwqK of YwqJK toxin-antitoxin module
MWENNEPNGFGCVKYPIEMDMIKGNVFCGEFKNGKKDGLGTLYVAKEQKVYHGRWDNDKLNGEVIIKSSENSYSIVKYEDGK